MFANMNTKKSTPKPEPTEDLVSAYQFAARCNPKVSATAVYNKIKAGIIIAKKVAGRDVIDWNKYKDVKFESNRTKNKNDDTSSQTED